MKVMHVLMALAVCAAASTAIAAPLPPGTSLYKPGFVQPGGSAYVSALPGYISAANKVGADFVSNMTLDFVGTVTTSVYNNPLGGYTFVYTFANTGGAGAPILIRATFDANDWAGVNITNAGANSTGSSGTGDPTAEWSDGSPYIISRAETGYPQFQWRVANTGTVLGSGDTSSSIFLETTSKALAVSDVGLLDGGSVGKAQVLVVPAPAAALLGAMGLGMIGYIKRRFR